MGEEAQTGCESSGRRLCTKDELLAGICCGVNGNCDSYPIWTSEQKWVSATTETMTTTPMPQVLVGRLRMTVTMAEDFVREPNVTSVLKVAIAEFCNVNVSWV